MAPLTFAGFHADEATVSPPSLFICVWESNVPALLPALTDPAVSLLPSGALSLNASGPELAYRAELQLQGEVLPGESEWFSTSQKIELTIVKAARSRWTQLLKRSP